MSNSTKDPAYDVWALIAKVQDGLRHRPTPMYLADQPVVPVNGQIQHRDPASEPLRIDVGVVATERGQG